jgi:hypothetical protein
MPPLRVRVTWFVVLLAAALLFLQRCATPARHHAVPHDLEVAACVVGFPDEVRYSPRDPGDIELITRKFVNSWEREKTYLHTQVLPPTSYLATSGGGDNGAFGAGFFNGWTKAGTRPQFKLVTGVSTGALIAPFAFLGPARCTSISASRRRREACRPARAKSLHSLQRPP